MLVQPISRDPIPVAIPVSESRITRAVEDTRAVEAGEAVETVSLDNSQAVEEQNEAVFTEELYSLLRERNTDDIRLNDEIEESNEGLKAAYIAMLNRPVRVETVHGFAVDVQA
jgi:hypothetical protein